LAYAHFRHANMMGPIFQLGAIKPLQNKRIKLPKLDCALAGHSEVSPGSLRGRMAFCWSGKCGNRPCWAGHYMPCRAGWVGPTVLLCIYGFCSMLRPIEPFLIEFLTGPYKNLTIEQALERIVLRHLRPLVSPNMDPLQFAYQPGIGADDAVIYLLQRSLSHLEDAGNTVRITFFDFSSAFNTIHPSLLRVKLERAGASDQLAAWVTNYLTDRPQFVRLQDCVSDVVVCSTGAPQGTVLSPFLFTLYTSDFTYSTDSCHLQKFSDDTAIVGCVSEGNDCEYRKVIMDFVDWCELNHLQVNASKTKEMVIDFSRKPSDIAPVNIQGLDIERVRTYKYLGVHLNNKLDWTDNTDSLYKRGQSRLLHAEEAGIFLWSAGEGGCSERDKKRLNRLIKRASSVCGCPLDSIEVMGERRALAKLSTIMDNTSHPLHQTVGALSSSFSSNRLRHPRCRKEHFHSHICYISIFTCAITPHHSTSNWVTRQVYPVWTYSTLLLLVPVLLVTDVLRYKPVIILQGLTYVTTFLLLLVGSGVHLMQLALFCYSIAMAGDVAYFSYIYSVVLPSYYQRVTSYVRAAILLGYTVGALLAQLLVSVGGVSLHCLALVTLISVSVALVTTFFLPMPKTSLFLKGTYSAQQGNSGEDSQDFSIVVKSTMAGCQAHRRCGFYQVTGYVQLLWVHIQPHNFTAYNGGVDAISTLTGAAATVAVGHMSLEWSVWGELVLGGFTFLIAGTVFLMDLTDNIWISYTCFILFKTVYMQLATICTFQIAKTLSRSRYALVFGINSFVGTVLQSVLTAIVINTKSLQLTITSQFESLKISLTFAYPEKMTE
ncbi:hypothetical protein L3Q82_025486, partial [Scortum barcoo]